MARATMSDVKANPHTLSAAERQRIVSIAEEEIERAAAEDAVNPAWSEEKLDRAAFARDVRQARERVGMTQPVFAERFHIALSRLRDWERARYRPDSVAAAYIKAIKFDPQTVERALAAKD